ncbi:MAG TPA: DUF2461 domain-containing protein, partial [Candidatus Limnocylindrales bacterium]
MGSGFEGFRQEAFDFLIALGLNNDRAWFTPRKAEYEALLKEPLERFCVALGEAFVAHGVPMRADERSPFRIYRDVRFSKDKSPYKTNLGASFPWAGEGGGVGGYLHFAPGESWTGGGMYHPSPARLAAWRSAVVNDRRGVHRAIDDKAFVKAYGKVSEEETLKRVPTGYDPADPDAGLLKLKGVVFGRPVTDAEALSKDLPERIASDLAASVPVMRYLAMLPGLEEGSPG